MSRPLSGESVFRAIADPTRRRVIEMLLKGERPVSDIVASIRLKPPAASYHLRVLSSSGILKQRRRGTQRMYRVDGRALEAASQWLGRCVSAASAA